MTYVVVSGDDLGMSPAVNVAIDKAFREGILTSASLIANMPAFDQAVQDVIAPNPGLGVGVHLVLTSGAPVSVADRVPLLVDSHGVFRHGFFGIRRLVCGRQRSAALAQIERECRAQCEKALSSGVRIDHLDGHRHIQMIPEVWPIVVEVAREYGCPYVRLADERWPATWHHRAPGVLARNLPKKILLSSYARRNRLHLSRAVAGRSVRTVDHVVGILDSGAMTPGRLAETLARVPPGATEIIMHPGLSPEAAPGFGDSPDAQRRCAAKDLRFASSPNRRRELEALTSAAVAESTARRGVRLTSFRELAATAPQAA